jgi:hypothetical protein
MANAKKQARRQGALVRLTAQRASGVKPVKKENWAGISERQTIPLDEKDIIRIDREIALLKQRA